MLNKSAMTVGQLSAGSTAVGPNAVLAGRPGGLVPHQNGGSALLEPAQVKGKPFSFHFRANREPGLAEEEATKRQTGRSEKVFGKSPDEEQPLAGALGADIPLAAALASTALETARGIIAELLVAPPELGGAAEPAAEGRAAAADPSAAQQTPPGNPRKPGDITQATAFQELESPRPTTVPRAAIEELEPGSPPNRAHAGRSAKQGTEGAFFGRGASDPSAGAATPSGPLLTATEHQPRPVENSPLPSDTDAANLGSGRAVTIQGVNVPDPVVAPQTAPDQTVFPDPGKPAQRHRDPNRQSVNQRSETAPASPGQVPDTVGHRLPLSHEVSPEEKILINKLQTTYVLNQIASKSPATQPVSTPEAVVAQSLERGSEQTNTPSARPGPDSAVPNFPVPTTPKSSIAAKAAALPVPAARFSLRPAQTVENEGANTATVKRRFSTGNPQTTTSQSRSGSHLKGAESPANPAEFSTGNPQRASGQVPAQVELRTAHSAAEPQPSEAGSRQHARTAHPNSAEKSLAGNDLRSVREPVLRPNLSPPEPRRAAEVAIRSQDYASGRESSTRPTRPARAALEGARRHGGPTPSSMGSKVLTASEWTRMEASLVSSGQQAAPPAHAARRQRVHQNGQNHNGLDQNGQNGRSGPEPAQSQKGTGSPEQPEVQPSPETPLPRRSASRAPEREPGASVRSIRSDSGKAVVSRGTAVPEVRRPAGDRVDTAPEMLLRQAESSPRVHNVFSRPVDANNRAADSHLERVRAVERVVELASLQKSADLNQMNIVLRDSHLGRLSLRLVERNGLIDTLLRTDNSRAGQLIGDNLPQMLESLSQRGFEVSHSGSGAWGGWQQEQRQNARQRTPRPPVRQGQKGPRAEHAFRLETDS